FNEQFNPKIVLPIVTNNHRKKDKTVMSKIKLNLNKLSVTDKIAKGRQIVTAMTNNTSFPNPSPPLSEITTALDDLTQAFAKLQAAKSEVTKQAVTQDKAEVIVDQTLSKLASYVESVAGKDEALIASTGMETKAPRSAPTVPSVPQAITAEAGEHDGEINLF